MKVFHVKTFIHSLNIISMEFNDFSNTSEAEIIELIEDLIVKVVELRNAPSQWREFTQKLKRETKAIEESLDIFSAIN